MKRGRRYAVAFLLSALAVAGTIFPGWAADVFYLRYGLLGFTVPLQAIENFADTGADPHLDLFLRALNPTQRSRVQSLLKATYDVDLMMVTQFTYTNSGERLLQEVGETIRTASGQNGFLSLRSAAILSAADPAGVSVLNFLRYLPVDMQIDLPKALAFQRRLAGLLQQTTQVASRVVQDTQQSTQLKTEGLPDPLPLDPREPGTVAVERQTLTLSDRSRDRTITLDLYRPASSTPAPLIVVSNGLGAKRDRFTRLANHLASHGFVVATLDHPGSDRERLREFYRGMHRENFDPAEFTNRPLDISFLLNELDRLQHQGQLQGINVNQVGVFGYSFGGTTALSLAGADVQFSSLEPACNSESFILNISLLYQCQALQAPPPPPLRDDRIKAVYAFLPFGKSLFGSNLNQISIPVLWESSDEDLLTPLLEEQIPAFRQLTTPERYFVLTRGLPHARISHEIAGGTSGGDRPNWDELKAISERYQRALTLTFFKTYVANDDSYRPFLSPTYATQLAEPNYPIGWVHSLDALDDPTD